MARSRKKPDNSIKTIKGPPPMPPDFKGDQEQVRAWNDLINLLSKQGNLQETDAAVIELTAITFARVRRLDRELKTVPLFVTNDRGVPIEHPLSKQQATYTTKLSKLLNDLRLTPVTRSKAVEPTFDPEEEAYWTVS